MLLSNMGRNGSQDTVAGSLAFTFETMVPGKPELLYLLVFLARKRTQGVRLAVSKYNSNLSTVSCSFLVPITFYFETATKFRSL